MVADIRVHGGGGLYLFRAESEAGSRWLDEQLDAQEYQFISGGIAVEGIGYARPIVDAAIADGLTVA